MEEVLDEGVVNFGPACHPHSPGDAMVAGIPTPRTSVFDASCCYSDPTRYRGGRTQIEHVAEVLEKSRRLRLSRTPLIVSHHHSDVRFVG
jgi:hypothetical protein